MRMTDGVLCLRSSSSAIATDAVGWRGWGGKTRRKVTAGNGREGLGWSEEGGCRSNGEACLPPPRERSTIVVCCPLHRRHCCRRCCLPSCCHHYYQRRHHPSSRHHLVNKTTHPPLAPLAPLGIPSMATEATSTTRQLSQKKPSLRPMPAPTCDQQWPIRRGEGGGE